MRIREIQIKHFRAIKSLLWKPRTKIACLIGQGDVGKSTILDAIEYALSPRYDITFSDIDFHKLDVSKEIEIMVTVGQLPNELTTEFKFGHYLRGWNSQDGVIAEPHDSESVLSIKFTVNEDLEPTWKVWNERDEEIISPSDRGKLGMSRIGTRTAQHLRWSKRSALYRATTDIKEALPVLADLQRTARDQLSEAQLESYKTVAEAIEAAASKLGVGKAEQLLPGYDPLPTSFRTGAISLHHEVIPVSASGAGTQKLTAIAAQQMGSPDGAILLLDEIETGIEPHRLRHLLRVLREQPNVGQAVLTSHSPVVIAELKAQELSVMHRPSNAVVIKPVPAALQGTIRSSAEALLSQGIVVCEGTTEVGMLRAFDVKLWTSQKHPPLAHQGIFPLNGGGSTAPRRALDLSRLGYRVALFIDGDIPMPSEVSQQLKTFGVPIIQWSDGMCTESRLCKDLPLRFLDQIVTLAISTRGEDSVRSLISNQLSEDIRNSEWILPSHWIEAGVPEPEMRRAIAKASTIKNKEWFKRVGHGEDIGEIVATAISEIADSDLARQINRLKAWAHSD